jgi:hypothetical protein
MEAKKEDIITPCLWSMDRFREPVSWGLYILLELLTLINSGHDCTANQRTPNNEVEPGTPRSGIFGTDTALVLAPGVLSFDS